MSRPNSCVTSWKTCEWIRIDDAWSRKVVGWSMANHLRAELVLDVLEMAVGQHRLREVIHYSDHGSQYTSLAFGNCYGEAGVRPSMGSSGGAYDNAIAESFLSTLECELLARRNHLQGRGPYGVLQLHRGLV